jgi:hypothetical protein
MELVPEHVHRALKYIETMNRGQEAPTPADVDAFATKVPPAGGGYRSPMESFAAQYGAILFQTRDPEPVCRYMESMGWIDIVAERVRLTSSGSAFLRGLDGKAEEQGALTASAVVLLEPNSPMAPVHLARAAADAGAGMYVDKYLREEHLAWVLQNTALTKLLVGLADQRGVLATALGALPNADRISVRLYEGKDLHDRALVRADGGVTLIGASINGVGKNATVIVPLPAAVSGEYAKHLERMWAAAEPIEPTTITSQGE